MVGRLVLVQVIGVRIPVPEPGARSGRRPRRATDPGPGEKSAASRRRAGFVSRSAGPRAEFARAHGPSTGDRGAAAIPVPEPLLSHKEPF